MISGVNTMSRDSGIHLRTQRSILTRHHAPSTTACTQDGIQRHSLVEQTQNGRDLVDALQTGDHAQHTAQNGGAAELFGCAVADPCGQVAEEAGVHQTQQGADESQCGDVSVVRHHLTDQGVDAGAQTGSHNARDQGDKDIAKGLEQLLDLALLLPGLDCGLVGCLLYTSDAADD